MNSTSSFHRPKTLSKRLLLALSSLLLAQSTMAVIIVHFVEEGDDVRVSFSGSIEISGATSPMAFGPSSSSISNELILAGGTGNRIGSVGSIEDAPFINIFVSAQSTEIFGYNDSALFFSDRHNTSPVAGVPTILETDPSLDNFLLPRTLSELNATADDIAEGALLWTANGTGDTFVFSRLAPIPEPSVIALGGIALLGLLRRRR